MSAPIPWLDLWQRGDGIFGAMGGMRVEIRAILNPPADGPHYRLYLSPRPEALAREETMPTTLSRRLVDPPPRPPAARSNHKTLNACLMQLPFGREELGIEEED